MTLESGFFAAERHKNVAPACVSDSLPPSAALPLYKGENVMSPLAKGDGREAAGGRSHTSVREFQFAHSRNSAEITEMSKLQPAVREAQAR
ncbi:MAG: hypothetical protein DMG13_15235 [Acidobacteria bacterium]|nr:MAG: hypothetical protein DMG13_15235 [Acidobacteriota bacterium]